jgi:hypothetical protein
VQGSNACVKGLEMWDFGDSFQTPEFASVESSLEDGAVEVDYPLDNPENVAHLESWMPIRDTSQRITLSAGRVRHFSG